MKTTTRDRLREEYAELVKDFAKKVKNLKVDGIPAPHIPIVGNHYDNCAYKIAFVGMETYGWYNIHEFLNLAKNKPKEAVTKCEGWFDPKGMIKNSGKGTFWEFIIKFLERFYNLKEGELKKVKEDGSYHEILSSIIWGNSNSIERYTVTAKRNGADFANWKKVKEYSKSLDSINHIIKAAEPRIVIITYKYIDKDYILGDGEIYKEIPEAKLTFSCEHRYSCENSKHDIVFRYFYLREHNTHVFVTPHPTWIDVYSGIGSSNYIDVLIKVIKEYKIWSHMPECIDDWEQKNENKSDSIYKYKLIAELANFMVERGLVMTGQELQIFFNNNKIRKRGGTKYSEEGGRGIHSVIKFAWRYFYNKREYQIALNISRAFVGRNLHYTYK